VTVRRVPAAPPTPAKAVVRWTSSAADSRVRPAVEHDGTTTVVLATKFFMPMGDEPDHAGGSRRWIMQEVEHSLRRLGTDHIDLYQVHRPSPTTDVEETLSALTDLARQGKVRSIGGSTRSSRPA
jgi:aryl-alcohol dehydrogenase-like predicted oxidoreductase